jgi:hypothetical protein
MPKPKKESRDKNIDEDINEQVGFGISLTKVPAESVIMQQAAGEGCRRP